MSRKNKQYQPRKGISSKFNFLDEYLQYILYANKDDWRKLTVLAISVLVISSLSLISFSFFPCFTFSLFPLPFSLFSNTFNEIFREDAEGNVELIWKDLFLCFFRNEQLANPYIVFSPLPCLVIGRGMRNTESAICHIIQLPPAQSIWKDNRGEPGLIT